MAQRRFELRLAHWCSAAARRLGCVKDKTLIDESSRYSQEAYSEYDHISLALLLAFLSTRWLFEGIVGGLYAEVALLGLGTASLIVGALRRKLSSLVWLLYCLSILMSLTLHGATTNIALRATLVGMIVVYQLLGVKSVQSYARFTRWLAGVGMIHAGFVLVHCLTGSAFNTAYFPILKSDASELATEPGCL